jgi:UDP-GlcNAc3NAcA epimerase
MKIVTVIGARPQFVKAAVVERALAARLPRVDRILVHTGQHYDANMSDVFFDELGIPAPQYHLGVGGLAHGAMTGRLIEKIEALLQQERPALVLVYGDTDSTLAGALAAAKLRIPVAHVEAGLRSFDKAMPEEINRVLTDHVSDLLFTPSEVADRNLRAEGIGGDRVLQVGDVMYDACLAFSGSQDAARQDRTPYLVCTLHRAGNTDTPELLAGAVELLQHLARSVRVVFPLHPRTRKCLEQAGLLARVQASCEVIDPVGYIGMLQLLAGCEAVLTDSGGLQKEAYYTGRRCLVLRDTTEWRELVDEGHARLHPLGGGLPDTATIDWLLGGPLAGERRLYGGGRACSAVASAVASRYFPQEP